jgi:hypothetical protein
MSQLSLNSREELKRTAHNQKQRTTFRAQGLIYYCPTGIERSHRLFAFRLRKQYGPGAIGLD